MGWKAVGAMSGAGTVATSLSSVALPTHSEGDLLVGVGLAVGVGDTTCTISGWVEKAYNSQGSGGSMKRITVLTKVAGASESAPTFDFSVAAGTCIGAAIFSLDSIHADQEDVAEVDSGTGDSSQLEYTPTGLTTNTNDATVVSIIGTNDNNEPGLKSGSEQSFTGRLTGNNSDVPTERPGSLGIASREVASAGSVTMPTWEQTVNYNDEWCAISMAFKPVGGDPPTAGLTIDFSTDTITYIGGTGGGV